MKACHLLVAAIVPFVLVSCETTSSSTPLSQTPAPTLKAQWDKRISESYPAWQPPAEMPDPGSAVQSHESVPQPSLVLSEGGDAEESKPLTYTVKNGDSLSKISRAVYGSPSKWRDIYEANRDMLKSPDSLRIGMELNLPHP